MLSTEITSFRHDYVLVRRLPIPATTLGGIILPLKAIELPQLGRILHVGWKNPEGLQPGDLVLLPKFGGLCYAFDSEDLYLFRTGELLAVIQ